MVEGGCGLPGAKLPSAVTGRCPTIAHPAVGADPHRGAQPCQGALPAPATWARGCSGQSCRSGGTGHFPPPAAGTGDKVPVSPGITKPYRHPEDCTTPDTPIARWAPPTSSAPKWEDTAPKWEDNSPEAPPAPGGTSRTPAEPGPRAQLGGQGRAERPPARRSRAAGRCASAHRSLPKPATFAISGRCREWELGIGSSSKAAASKVPPSAGASSGGEEPNTAPGPVASPRLLPRCLPPLRPCQPPLQLQHNQELWGLVGPHRGDEPLMAHRATSPARGGSSHRLCPWRTFPSTPSPGLTHGCAEVTPAPAGGVAGPQTPSFTRTVQDALKRPKLSGAGGAGCWRAAAAGAHARGQGGAGLGVGGLGKGGPGRLQGAQCPLTRLFPYLAVPLPATQPPEPGRAQNRPKLTQGQARVPAAPHPRGTPAGGQRARRGQRGGPRGTQSALLLGRSLRRVQPPSEAHSPPRAALATRGPSS